MTNLITATLLSVTLYTNRIERVAPSGQDYFATNIVTSTRVIAYAMSNEVTIVTSTVPVSITVDQWTGNWSWTKVPLGTKRSRSPLTVPDGFKTNAPVNTGPPPLPPGLKDK